MDMLRGSEIAEARLADWRKLAQGLHARYRVPDFGAGARFVTAVAEAAGASGHHPTVCLGAGYVDLKVVSTDAVFRDEEGTELVVEWVTQQDVDLARRISEVAAGLALEADPEAVCVIELGLDTARSAAIAPVWAALLTGDATSQGRGTPGDEIRDATGRTPNLWFGDAVDGDAADGDAVDGSGADGPDGDGQGPRQRFHVEVYVGPAEAERRLAAVVAAGGTIVDDTQAPGLTVVADADGNRGVLCVAHPPHPS